MNTLKKIQWKEYSIVLVLLVLIVFFSFVNPIFASWKNIYNIILQNTYFIIAAVAMSFVMIGGGIDLSVGYQMSLVGVVTAMLMVDGKIPVWLCVVIGLLLGTILGALNGIIVTRIKIFPLIATLATSTVFQGISYLVSGAKTIRSYPASFLYLVKGKILGVPLDFILAIAVIILASIIYNKTYFGRYIFATGGNEEAAHLAGIKTGVIRVGLYAICGFGFALATMVMIAKSNTTTSSFGPGTEFTCLTAAIIGGISFKGGEGKIWGLIVGVFILQVLSNGMQLAGWGTYAQYIVKGTILLLAVAFDELQKQRRYKPAKENTPEPVKA